MSQTVAVSSHARDDFSRFAERSRFRGHMCRRGSLAFGRTCSMPCPFNTLRARATSSAPSHRAMTTSPRANASMTVFGMMFSANYYRPHPVVLVRLSRTDLETMTILISRIPTSRPA
jgi:hypothetical protein